MELEKIFLLLGLTILFLVVIVDTFYPRMLTEGFEVLRDTSFVGNIIPKRGDIGPQDEEGGYIRDDRYFSGYVDVQRLGVKNDFCRMVQAKGKPDVLFLACALAGTENMSSVDYRTMTLADGLKMSRDDYMRDINNDGRDDYCRILKSKDGSYQPLCNRATDSGFDERLVVDSKPPDEIKKLLTFYEGCVFWLRFRDDMLDYVNNIQVYTMGNPPLDEKPRPPITNGLRLNGIDQFLRVGDSVDLEMGYKVPMRSLRAIMFWVYFDEFTNNAHILDFGNGPGRDNVFVGIVGRGDEAVSADEIRPNPCGEESTLPSSPSGAQPVDEVSPQELMLSTSANVNEFTCKGFEVSPRRLPPSRVQPLAPKILTGKASLLYEVWDNQQRKMRIKINSVIEKRKWTHIAITAVELDSFRPTIKVYINGEDVYTKPSGHLPQATTMTNNYIGKSNWVEDTSQYENKDELFQGSVFDVRGYKTPLSAQKIIDSFEWGADLLGIDVSQYPSLKDKRLDYEEKQKANDELQAKRLQDDKAEYERLTRVLKNQKVKWTTE